MAQTKDVSERRLESYNDVFADIVNVLAFGGRRIVREEDLSDVAESSDYTSPDGDLRSQERDIVKLWRREGKIRLSLLGLENQTRIDSAMPLRVMSYDAAAYRSQLNSKERPNEGKKLAKKRKRYYPVVTFVLYFGTKQKWTKKASLYEVLDVAEELKPLVADYRINVFNLAWLTNEQIEMFTSDFKDVALFLRAQRTKTQYRGSKRKTRHIKDLLAVLTALSGSNIYAEYANTLQEEEQSKDKGGYTMDWVTAELLNTGRSEGIAEGLAEGLVKGRDEMMKMMSMLFRSLRESGKEEELDRALTDQEYLRKLMDDFQQKEQTQS